MAPTEFIDFYARLNIQANPDTLWPIFKWRLDVPTTLDLHQKSVADFLEWMHEQVDELVVDLPGSTTKWVPYDLIVDIYSRDNNLRKRLDNFLKKCSSDEFKQLSEEQLDELNLAEYGPKYISYDASLLFLLSESVVKGRKRKSKHVSAPNTSMVVEPKPIVESGEGAATEEEQNENVEAEDEEDKELSTSTELSLLNPIMIEGREFLLLHDIQRITGLREDEALSTIANIIGQEEFVEETELQTALQLTSFEGTLEIEEVVANAIVSLSNQPPPPPIALPPVKPYQLKDYNDEEVKEAGVVNLEDLDLDMAEEYYVTTFEIDDYVRRAAGSREPEGEASKNFSLRHYIEKIHPSIIRVAHNQASEEGGQTVTKLKILSEFLSDEPLPQAASKVFLVL